MSCIDINMYPTLQFSELVLLLFSNNNNSPSFSLFLCVMYPNAIMVLFTRMCFTLYIN